MTGKDFYACVKDHKEFEWLGVTKEGEVAVEQKSTGHIHVLPVDSILGNPWGELEELLMEKRESTLMIQRTRIVGYWSRISQWNASKISELADRHKGQYGLSEKTGHMDQTVPKEVVEILASGGANMVCELPQLAEVA